MKPLVSETFSNDAVTASATYPNVGSPSSNVANSTVTFSFDASTGTYTISTSGRTQSFTQSQRDAALSSAEADVYTRSSGSTNESLFVTTNSADAGTRSNPKFQYVGGAVWQRTTNSSSGISGTIDAITYGIVTPNAALPRTGSAEYEVRLLGISDQGAGPWAVRGAGKLTADFASGSVGGQGYLHTITPGGREGDRPWVTSAGVSSSSNGFTGSFGLGDPFSLTPKDTSGSIRGRFYGPTAQEVGASWYWRDSLLGPTFVGILIGKDQTLFPNNASLRGLHVDEDLANAGFLYETQIDSTTGANFNGGEPNPHPARDLDISYSETTNSLILNYSTSFANEALLASRRNSAQSDLTYDVYDFSKTESDGKTIDYKARVFRPADNNPKLALTYTSFANIVYQKPDYGPYVSRKDGWVAFGQATPEGSVPNNGTASYSGLLFGQSDVAQAANGSNRTYEISGTSHFIFDFAAATLGGWIRPAMTDATTGTQYDLGQYNFGSTNFTVGSQTFSGNFTQPVPYPYGENSFNGQFTGPNAQELFARWITTTRDPVTNNPLDIFGVTIGKKD